MLFSYYGSKLKDVSNINGFDWDNWNLDKSWLKHGAHWRECETVFDHKMLILDDTKHSHTEDRFIALGVSDHGRFLCVIFIIRNNKFRIISARDQNKKERKSYFDDLAG